MNEFLYHFIGWFVDHFGGWGFLILGALITLATTICVSLYVHFTFKSDI